jgi:hypothetical protein
MLNIVISWIISRFRGVMAGCQFKDLYLTRLYHEGSDPNASVLKLPREEAIKKCEELAPWRRYGGKEGQEAYLDGRIETENLLRESARNAGVDIKEPHALYFTLTAEDQTKMAPAGKKILSIPVEKANLKNCSFTFGDSMGNRTPGAPTDAAHPLQDVVMNADQIAKVVAKEGIPGDYLKGGRYIEVQMWADIPAEYTKPAAEVTVAPVTAAPATPAKPVAKSSFSVAL